MNMNAAVQMALESPSLLATPASIHVTECVYGNYIHISMFFNNGECLFFNIEGTNTMSESEFAEAFEMHLKNGSYIKTRYTTIYGRRGSCYN